MQDKKPVILCIDDDKDILYVLRAVLEGAGYRVIDAFSASEGLKMYKAVEPDLLIVDLMMEEVDAGSHLVRELQALGNKAPIFMLSSVGDQFYRNIDYSGLGLSGVLQKPIEPNSLLATLKMKLAKT